MLKRFATELREELGITNMPPLTQIIDLGRLAMDPGMTNNRPQVFVAIMSSEHAPKIKLGISANPDEFEMRAGVLVIPVSSLPRLILENEDPFFHACITRLAVHGINLLTNVP